MKIHIKTWHPGEAYKMILSKSSSSLKNTVVEVNHNQANNEDSDVGWNNMKLSFQKQN